MKPYLISHSMWPTLVFHGEIPEGPWPQFVHIPEPLTVQVLKPGETPEYRETHVRKFQHKGHGLYTEVTEIVARYRI